jgi:hypothetical protein
MMSSSKGARLDVYQQSRRHTRKSLMGKEIRYTLEQWTMLCRIIAKGQVEIDKNLVENAIRPTAVGKKNWLFIGDNDAGWRSAVIYSIITSCRSRASIPLPTSKMFSHGCRR